MPRRLITDDAYEAMEEIRRTSMRTISTALFLLAVMLTLWLLAPDDVWRGVMMALHGEVPRWP